MIKKKDIYSENAVSRSEENNINVLILTKYFHPFESGSEKTSRYIAEYMSANGDRVHIFALKGEGEMLGGRTFFHNIGENPLYTFLSKKLYMKEISDMLFSFIPILLIIIRYRIKLVYLHYTEAMGLSGLAAAKIMGVKTAVLWPTSSLRHFKMTENPLSFLINRIFTRASDVFIAKGMSAAQMKKYLRIRTERLHYSVNPVEYGDYSSAELPENPPEKMKVLYLGKYNDFKRADFLIKAIILMTPERRRRFEVNLYGNGPDEAYLKELVQANGLDGEVHVNPPSRNVKQILGESHIYVYPSPFEPAYSQSILESLCAGRITICRYTEGIARFFKDGRDIIGIRDMNEHSIADKLLWAADNYREAFKIAESGRRIVRDVFTFKNFFEQTDRIVKEGIYGG